MTITNTPATNFPYSTQQMSDNVHWLLYSFGIMTSSRPSRIVSVVEGNTMRLLVQPYDEEQPHRHILALLNDDDGRQLATYVCLHGGAADALTHHAATASEREERIVPCSVSERVAYSLTAVQGTLPRTFRENPYEGLQNVVHIPAELWC